MSIEGSTRSSLRNFPLTLRPPSSLLNEEGCTTDKDRHHWTVTEKSGCRRHPRSKVEKGWEGLGRNNTGSLHDRRRSVTGRGLRPRAQGPEVGGSRIPWSPGARRWGRVS